MEWQLCVASGEKIPLTQGEIPRVGHAFEARVYAECPERSFLPSHGTIRRWKIPGDASALAFDNFGYVRVDSGVREGDDYKCTPLQVMQGTYAL